MKFIFNNSYLKADFYYYIFFNKHDILMDIFKKSYYVFISLYLCYLDQISHEKYKVYSFMFNFSLNYKKSKFGNTNAKITRKRLIYIFL